MADTDALAITVGLLANTTSANAEATVASTATVGATVGSGSNIVAPGAAVTVRATGNNRATTEADGGGGGTITIVSMKPKATVEGGTSSSFAGKLVDGTLDAQSLTVEALGQNKAEATSKPISIGILNVNLVTSEALVGSGAGIAASVAEGASIATSGAVLVDARYQANGNEAIAKADVGGGGVVSITNQNVLATVGAPVSAAMDGSVVDASQVTVQATGRNRADGVTDVISVGGLTVSESDSDSRITNTADVNVSAASTAKVSTDGTFLMSATSDNVSKAKSDAGTGGIIGISLAKPEAKTAGGTSASFDGEVTRATTITVEAIGKNTATGNSALTNIGLIAGTNASPQATVESGALTSASIGSNADIGVANGAVDVTVRADGSSLAETYTEIVGGGVISVTVSNPYSYNYAQTSASQRFLQIVAGHVSELLQIGVRPLQCLTLAREFVLRGLARTDV